MKIQIDTYRSEAENLMSQRCVREILFADGTYQIEIKDLKAQETFWPFLQFNAEGELQDAFCSCPQGELGCPHLAAAYLTIFSHGAPLHIRFERSFWNALCKLFGEYTNFDSRSLKKISKGHYQFKTPEVSCELICKEEFKDRLERLIELRPKETPETSLKFSNLSQEEITNWKSGRPSSEVRYLLSFWFDLGKEMLFLQDRENYTIIFKEDVKNYPTSISIQWEEFTTHWTLTLEGLVSLIPFLNTVASPLKVFSQAEVKAFFFDRKKRAFWVEHGPQKDLSGQTLSLIGGWHYISGKGFYAKNLQTPLDKTWIYPEEMPEILDLHRDEIQHCMPIHDMPKELSYAMHFDENRNWHFEAFLFEKGDLVGEKGFLIGKWAFIDKKGFFRIKGKLFDEVIHTILPGDVSSFINQHRIFLNSTEDFQIHLASVESHLTYNVSKEGRLTFKASEIPISPHIFDFGDWVYYANIGFFSKKHRQGIKVDPGLQIPAFAISDFIKSAQEELEAIPSFFTNVLPFEKRGLELHVHSKESLHVKPVDILLPGYEQIHYQIFGDYVYTEGRGFKQLPLEMRLPEKYQFSRIIEEEELVSFFEEEFPTLQKWILFSDHRLRMPHVRIFEIEYFARARNGKLKAHLFFRTEYGKISFYSFYEKWERNERYLFSEAGLIDLNGAEFLWLNEIPFTVDKETFAIELRVMDFYRLDAYVNFQIAQGSVWTEDTTKLLNELRSFTIQHPPNLEGLKSELRSYQKIGVNWLWFLYKNGLSGLLCDDMGLGKTHQAMALMAAIANQSSMNKCLMLVICPTSVLYHWQDKLKQFLPNFPVHTFHGTKRSLKKLKKKGIILSSYGVLRIERKALKELSFDLAVFDEIQLAKNPSSRAHKAGLEIGAHMKLGLSGTPIENNLKDLKALMDIVLPGYMPNDKKFREQFIVPIEKSQSLPAKELLIRQIKPFILRRRKTEVLEDLPEKVEDTFYCDLSVEQNSLYQSTLVANREALLANLEDAAQPIPYLHIFSLLGRLKQICDHPALFYKKPEAWEEYTSGKWDLFIELLEEARESDQKVVVFSQYLHMLDIIANEMQKRRWGYAEIRGSTVNRREELERFRDDPDCVVFLGSLQAAGLGIDLTAASIVILYDRWWNAARENQAIDRVHRIGQKWAVQVYRLICKETIEEKIDRMIAKKGRLLEEIVLAEDPQVLKQFSRDELITLLREA